MLSEDKSVVNEVELHSRDCAQQIPFVGMRPSYSER
jgi:hypothetical protein